MYKFNLVRMYSYIYINVHNFLYVCVQKVFCPADITDERVMFLLDFESKGFPTYLRMNFIAGEWIMYLKMYIPLKFNCWISKMAMFETRHLLQGPSFWGKCS